MIAVDTNVLICADRAGMPQHAAALAVLRRLAEGREAWALPVFCVGEFLRVISHPRVFDPPTPSRDALGSLESLLASPSVRLLSPGDAYLPLLADVVRDSGVTGNLVFDAQIVAVCLEHGVRSILTDDHDFQRFPGIEAVPLARFAG